MKIILYIIWFLLAVNYTYAQKKEHQFKSDWVQLKPKVQPPVIILKNPQAEQSVVEQSNYTIVVCVQSDAPVDNYYFIHNGKIIGGPTRGFKRVDCGQEVSQELTLIQGKNEIKFVATNAGGTTISNSYFITYTPVPSPVGTIASDAQIQKRLALIVANEAYSKYPLKNSINDGQAIRERLENLGFTVTLHENQNRKDFKKVVDAFTSSLTDKTISLFFYAGHGLMVNGVNYIQPVDADPTTEADVEFECFPLRQLVARMEETNPHGSNLVFWDACRNNPYRSWRRGAGEPVYAPTNPPVGTMIVYATEPGKSALDGDEKNGLFTSELIKHIDVPGQDIFELIDKVDRGLEMRGFKQPPYIEGRLRGKFIFNINK
ncbi:caspase family protein [Telluribacter sp. SYSU D00476]|uniref:caspase family protein n=1 Tax=Telluribacter sp. SYSU D00476 TaxID=2811430 RepID=UPI001FF37178|nr:caspase family protein [Telluribacter sp. SYSU D00476]